MGVVPQLPRLLFLSAFYIASIYLLNKGPLRIKLYTQFSKIIILGDFVYILIVFTPFYLRRA